MKNLRNGLHKIGRSLSPLKREKTLQSEEPEIEMVASWPGKTSDEYDLHKRFASKRIRGEWFNLDESDVLSIVRAAQ